MMNMGGVDPQQLAQVQEVSKHINGEITVDYAANTMTIKLSTVNEATRAVIPGLMNAFSNALAQQLHMFFGIQGKIVEKNKK